MRVVTDELRENVLVYGFSFFKSVEHKVSERSSHEHTSPSWPHEYTSPSSLATWVFNWLILQITWKSSMDHCSSTVYSVSISVLVLGEAFSFGISISGIASSSSVF